MSSLIYEKLHQQCREHEISSCMVEISGQRRFHYEKVKHASRELMPINSCTKSIVSALYCIGLGEGALPTPSTLVIEWFPELAAVTDPQKNRMTVEHLLTLTAGFKWNEFGGENHFPKMTRTSNWIQYVVEQPIQFEPGTRWCYHSGVSQMLAALIVRASGKPLDQFVEEKLFHFLNIDQYSWKRDPQGIHTGGYGMRLTAESLVTFGTLFLNQGNWQGKQLIEKQLVQRATMPYIDVEAPEKGQYGWHWWCDCDEKTKISYCYARGYGGQFVIIVPAAAMVVVFTRNQKHKGKSPLIIFQEEILPQISAN